MISNKKDFSTTKLYMQLRFFMSFQNFEFQHMRTSTTMVYYFLRSMTLVVVISLSEVVLKIQKNNFKL